MYPFKTLDMKTVTSETLQIGKKTFTAMRMQLKGCALLAIVSEQKPDVWMACGYVDILRAEKWDHALGIVSGVDNFEQMLTANIKALSTKAKAFGATEGMTGRDFLEKFG